MEDTKIPFSHREKEEHNLKGKQYNLDDILWCKVKVFACCFHVVNFYYEVTFVVMFTLNRIDFESIIMYYPEYRLDVIAKIEEVSDRFNKT